ncbi:photosynthetic complex assembly protein [Erythrobacter insulae]|uniref:Photosynthetic complex assembly protein n=1 Tax=Erythrobacter insulae TaxID=2584124 RepID=A0A547PCW3_9SPHN|nr:photosynthetic complex assembly protein PuhC [Erythrobacter insulae]TRD11986.1 photosynthetic complex assembly protein [Erythrobacter insulae]
MIVREYEEDEVTVHKVPLILAGGVAAISLALTAAVTLGFADPAAVPSEVRAADGTTTVSTRSIQFYDEADGTVRVEDAATGEAIDRFPPATGGFVRSSVRSLVHERRIRGIGAATPFELIEWSDGALSLRDSTTGEAIELASFGSDNRAVFAAMLK